MGPLTALVLFVFGHSDCCWVTPLEPYWGHQAICCAGTRIPASGLYQFHPFRWDSVTLGLKWQVSAREKREGLSLLLNLSTLLWSEPREEAPCPHLTLAFGKDTTREILLPIAPLSPPSYPYAFAGVPQWGPKLSKQNVWIRTSVYRLVSTRNVTTFSITKMIFDVEVPFYVRK